MTSKIAYLNSTHFGLKIKHKIPQRRSQDAHMTPQEGARRSKTAPGRLQDDPKTPPRRFKILSRRHQDGSKPPKTPQNASSLDLSNSIFSLPGPLKTNIFTPWTSKSHDFGGFWSLKWTQVDTKITSRNNIMLKQPESKKKLFFQ